MSDQETQRLTGMVNGLTTKLDLALLLYVMVLSMQVRIFLHITLLFVLQTLNTSTWYKVNM